MVFLPVAIGHRRACGRKFFANARPPLAASFCPALRTAVIWAQNFNSAKGGRSNMCTRAGCSIFARLFHNNDKDFNPRTHAGCDGGADGGNAVLHQFQSTHPRGVRQQTYTKVHCCLCFQYTFSTNACQFFGRCPLFFFPCPFILPFLSANLAGNSRPLGVRTAPKGGKSCDILRAASPPFFPPFPISFFTKNQSE